MHNAPPKLVENMDLSLQDINTKVEISIQYSSTQKHLYFIPLKSLIKKVTTPTSSNNKSSMVCMTTDF